MSQETLTDLGIAAIRDARAAAYQKLLSTKNNSPITSPQNINSAADYKVGFDVAACVLGSKLQEAEGLVEQLRSAAENLLTELRRFERDPSGEFTTQLERALADTAEWKRRGQN